METYEGQLVNKTARDWNGTMLYSFQLKGQNIWFRTGQKELNLDEGTFIKFEANPTNKQVNLDSMALSDSTSAEAPTTDSPAGASGQARGSSDRESYWQNRERLDSVRSARADATRLVVAALEHDQLPHPSNVAKGKRLDLLVGYIKELTEELIDYETK